VFAFAKDWVEARGVASAAPTALAPPRAGGSVALENVSLSVRARDGVVEILRKASLTVAAGEFVSLLGPSGSGKSTILNLVAGFVRPTSGRVRHHDADVVAPGPDRVVVFQDAALFPWLTLRHNIEFPMKLQGIGAAARAARSEELLRLVHLWRFQDRHPHELSGGMRQRGAIARALATDPEVLLMDEPFAALDAQTRELMQRELLRIWNETRKTVIFITHQIDEAVYLSDRVIVFSARPGRVREIVPIDIPRPRALHVKRTPHFLEYTDRIWRLIEEEVNFAMRS